MMTSVIRDIGKSSHNQCQYEGLSHGWKPSFSQGCQRSGDTSPMKSPASLINTNSSCLGAIITNPTEISVMPSGTEKTGFVIPPEICAPGHTTTLTSLLV